MVNVADKLINIKIAQPIRWSLLKLSCRDRPRSCVLAHLICRSISMFSYGLSQHYSSVYIIYVQLSRVPAKWTLISSPHYYTKLLIIISSKLGPRLNLASCKSVLTPPVVCSTDLSKAVVPVLVLLFVALWFILRGDLLYVFPCVILFLCFSVLRLPRLGKSELILVLFVRLFGLCLFRFVGFLFLLGSGRAAVCDCGTPWTFLLPFLRMCICCSCIR